MGKPTGHTTRSPAASRPDAAARDANIGEYRALHDVGPGIWMVLDTTGVILDINLAGSRTLGVAPRLIVGTPLSAWIADDCHDRLLEHLRACRMSVSTIETDMQLKARGGQRPLVRLYSRRRRLGGHIVVPSVVVDITEREHLVQERLRAERERDAAERERGEARASESAKDRLIAVVSHELRDPLSPALLAASVLKQWKDLPVKVTELAATIQRNIEIEAHLIDDLLDVTRATQGRLMVHKSIVDVHEVIRRAVSACAVHARARDVSIRVSLVAEHHHADADVDRLQQVFCHLLTNAIKFSAAGDDIAVHTSSDTDGAMRTTVRDHGIGMDASTLARLFHPFERPTAPASGRAGLGLGLTIAHSIIDMHGGRMWAASAGAAQGSTFEVNLPTVSREREPKSA